MFGEDFIPHGLLGPGLTKRIIIALGHAQKPNTKAMGRSAFSGDPVFESIELSTGKS
jgi:hypothetical protein